MSVCMPTSYWIIHTLLEIYDETVTQEAVIEQRGVILINETELYTAASLHTVSVSSFHRDYDFVRFDNSIRKVK